MVGLGTAGVKSVRARCFDFAAPLAATLSTNGIQCSSSGAGAPVFRMTRVVQDAEDHDAGVFLDKEDAVWEVASDRATSRTAKLLVSPGIG